MASFKFILVFLAMVINGGLAVPTCQLWDYMEQTHSTTSSTAALAPTNTKECVDFCEAQATCNAIDFIVPPNDPFAGARCFWFTEYLIAVGPLTSTFQLRRAGIGQCPLLSTSFKLGLCAMETFVSASGLVQAGTALATHTTYEACAAACAFDTTCVAFDFPVCYTYHDASLKYEMIGRHRDDVTGIRHHYVPDVTSCIDKTTLANCGMRIKRDLQIATGFTDTTATTFEDCYEACMTHGACFVWSFESGVCILTTSIDNTEAAVGKNVFQFFCGCGTPAVPALAPANCIPYIQCRIVVETPGVREQSDPTRVAAGISPALCLQLCLEGVELPNCAAIDWDTLLRPYAGIRCYMHTYVGAKYVAPSTRLDYTFQQTCAAAALSPTVENIDLTVLLGVDVVADTFADHRGPTDVGYAPVFALPSSDRLGCVAACVMDDLCGGVDWTAASSTCLHYESALSGMVLAETGVEHIAVKICASP